MEDIEGEEPKPYNERHYRMVLNEIEVLEKWMKKNHVRNNWSLSEKLAFLRNVEANIRTGAALRRTELAWIALVTGIIAIVVGFFFGRVL